MNCNRGTITAVRVLAVVMILSIAGNVTAGEAEDVRTLVEKGVVMAVTEGEKAVLRAIGSPAGPFIKGEHYLFAGPLDRVAMTAHPYKPELVGMDLSTFRDNHGNFLFFAFVKTALEQGAGWTEYMWPKPGATEVSRKMTYVMKVPGKDMYIGGGYYAE